MYKVKIKKDMASKKVISEGFVAFGSIFDVFIIIHKSDTLSALKSYMYVPHLSPLLYDVQ